VIRDAMSREGVVGLARVVLSSRERPFLVDPMGSGLRGVTLRFAHRCAVRRSISAIFLR
jgi:DNA end-binding protein Ku